MKNIGTKLIKKYKNRCDYLEIREEKFETLSINFNDSMESCNRYRNGGFAIRVIDKGGVAFASVVNENMVEKAIEELIEVVPLLSDGGVKLSEEKPFVKKVTLNIKNDPRKISIKEKREIFKKYNEKIRNYSEKITTSNVSYYEKFARTLFENSEGTKTDWENMDVFGMISATAVKDNITQRGHETVGTSTDFSKLLILDKKIDEACDIAIRLTEAPQVESGTYTVILDPALGGIFVHEAFGHTAEADGIVDSEDMMKIMKIGTKLGSDKLTIFDSGLFPGSRGYLPFDSEGVPSQKTYLIKNGIVSGHLHSRITAAKMGVKSSGSARAIDFRYPPIVRMRTTCIDGGNDTLEDMLKGIKKGLYCVKSNGGTGGEMFTFTTAYAYMIEDGKITTLVRDAKLSGNLFTTLKNIDMVGNDFKVYEMGGGCGKGGQFPLPVATGSPHIRIQNVVVGGA